MTSTIRSLGTGLQGLEKPREKRIVGPSLEEADISLKDFFRPLAKRKKKSKEMLTASFWMGVPLDDSIMKKE